MVKVRAALHEHGRVGGRYTDSSGFNRLIDLAVQRLGAGGIFALVNFADDGKYERVLGFPGTYEYIELGPDRNAIYVPEKEILVVKGQEVPTKQGHLLVLGIGRNRHLRADKSFEDTVKAGQDLGATIVSDHTFSSQGVGQYLKERPGYIKNIHAIETYNASVGFGVPNWVPKVSEVFPLGANTKAKEFYASVKQDFPHLGALSVSDGHSYYEFARSWTEIEQPDFSDFLNSFRTSVQNTNLSTPRKEKSALVGTLDHIADLAFIEGICYLTGKRLFNTERPSEFVN